MKKEEVIREGEAFRDGNNWFAYVNNDPVNLIDPWRLEDQVYTNSSNVTTLVPIRKLKVNSLV
jgi:hypothetical protein